MEKNHKIILIVSGGLAIITLLVVFSLHPQLTLSTFLAIAPRMQTVLPTEIDTDIVYITLQSPLTITITDARVTAEAGIIKGGSGLTAPKSLFLRITGNVAVRTRGNAGDSIALAGSLRLPIRFQVAGQTFDFEGGCNQCIPFTPNPVEAGRDSTANFQNQEIPIVLPNNIPPGVALDILPSGDLNGKVIVSGTTNGQTVSVEQDVTVTLTKTSTAETFTKIFASGGALWSGTQGNATTFKKVAGVESVTVSNLDKNNPLSYTLTGCKVSWMVVESCTEGATRTIPKNGSETLHVAFNTRAMAELPLRMNIQSVIASTADKSESMDVGSLVQVLSQSSEAASFGKVQPNPSGGSGGESNQLLPPQKSTSLTCSPRNQRVRVSNPATLLASGGDGTYSWLAPEGDPTRGGGQKFRVTYQSPGKRTVTLTSGEQEVTCSVEVQQKYWWQRLWLR